MAELDGTGRHERGDRRHERDRGDRREHEYRHRGNRAGTPLRIQIQGPAGDTDPTQRWCSDIVGQTDKMFWHSFNTECWEGGAGEAYDGIAPLQSMMVLVPGDTASRSFDFCSYELVEYD